MRVLWLHSDMANGKREIGIRALKDNLSATLARVRRGESITVKDRNTAIARIVPVGPAASSTSVVETLVKTGRVSWAGGKPMGAKNPPRVRGRSVADAVVEDRR
jgi:antitoxin (DNA-binding transcriptional repressor) of toxin-antitoxin stability system